MGLKQLKMNSLVLIGLVLILLAAGFYLVNSSTILQTLLINKHGFPPKIIPGEPYNPESFSCNSDEDCGKNICKCTAMNKKHISEEDKLCQRVCEGTAECINNICKLKMDKSANCYYSRIICVKAPCNPIRVCSGKNHSLIMAVVDNLSKRLSVGRDTVIVNSVTEAIWRDGSLGCPEPGKAYTLAVVGGYKISLSLEDKTYFYHTGPQERFILCENPQD
ncbi:MAG: hypothetical protein HYW33_03930 [Candidatus Blackburnbacteria bacterium]|nr:hypothetical protein [Candidatus Blackburnbacteria bacterium]